MNICVLNGSPKGKYSCTLHTVLYLEQKFPAHTFRVLHVGQRIRALEEDMTEAKAALSEADLILFVYPVYTFIAPSQLHRFIELLKESGLDLRGTYAAQITTSKHFFDTTAHAYIRDNCFDLGLRYIGGHSADMDDLLTEAGQAEAEDFLRYLEFAVEEEVYLPFPEAEKREAPVYEASLAPAERKEGFDTVILTDLSEGDTALSAMIEDFRAAYPYPTRVVNLREYPFSGGCLGCFRCAASGACLYRDGFDRFLREELQTADATVYAFRVSDHSMGARFKMYDDRQFCNGHRTVTMGKPVGYLILGDMSREDNLKTIIAGRADVGRNFLAGCATDKAGILALSKSLVYALEGHIVPPQTFLGVGGLKIFRDLIYVMRGMMKEDHRFYKKHGFYDFPQKKRGTILKMKLVGLLLSSPKVLSKMGNRLNEGMIGPYRKIVEKARDNHE